MTTGLYVCAIVFLASALIVISVSARYPDNKKRPTWSEFDVRYEDHKKLGILIKYYSQAIFETFYVTLSGYHADTPITIKAEAIHEADSRIH